MPSKKNICFVSTSVLALLFAASPALAQPGDGVGPVDAADSNEIIVTAQKRSESLNSVAMSIVAFSGDDLATKGVRSASDLVKIIPGFSASDSGGNAPVYTLRGVGLNESSLSANPAVAIYADEVPLPYAAMTRGAMLDLARVEVLKGPQGTLYGSNSTGGAINYIANEPKSEFGAGASLSYERFSLLAADGYIEGGLNSNLSGRFAFSVEQGGDWQRSQTRNDSLGQVDRLSARLLLKWEPTSDIDVTLNVNGWRDKSDTQAYQLQELVLAVPGNIGIAAPGLADVAPPRKNSRIADWTPGTDFARDDTFFQASLKANWQINDSVKLTSISSYSDLDTAATQDRDGTRFELQTNDFSGSVKSFYQEIRAIAEINNNINIIFGTNYRHDKLTDNYLNYLPDATNSIAAGVKFNGGKIASDSKVESFGVYLNSDFKINDLLGVHGGIRYSLDDRDISTCVYDLGDGTLAGAFTNIANGLRAAEGLQPITIPAGSCVTIGSSLSPEVFHGRLKEDNISWSTGIKLTPSRDLLIYASIGRGYKAGSFPTISAITTRQYVPVTQESVLSKEIGVKAAMFDRMVQINAAAFIYNYNNKQVRGRDPDPVFGLAHVLKNVPKSEIRGAELEATFRPARWASLSSSVTYIDAKVERFTGYDIEGSSLIDFKGAKLPFSPKWSVSVSPAIEVPLSPSIDLVASADLLYRSRSNAYFGSYDKYTIKDYTTIDLSIGLKDRDDRWSVSIYGRNITDEYYWSNVIRATDTYARIMAKPATYGIKLSTKY